MERNENGEMVVALTPVQLASVLGVALLALVAFLRLRRRG